MSVPSDPSVVTVFRREGRAIDWGEALIEHNRWLRTVALARLGREDRQSADEILQEVAVAVFKPGVGPADPAKLAPWLYRLTARLASLHRRKHGRRTRLVERYARRDARTVEDVQTADPLDWLISRERVQLVRAALNRLKARDAEILMLKHAEHWTTRDLAERLGLTLSAVEARLHRARGRLRAELADSISESEEVKK